MGGLGGVICNCSKIYMGKMGQGVRVNGAF